MTLSEIKNLIEKNPVAFATIMEGSRPNLIGISAVKVVAEDRILITDNYMDQTIKDISGNKMVCLLVWDGNLNGYKLIGEAEYHQEGQWLTFVKKMKENEGLSAKGAILVKILKIIPSK